MRTKLLLGTAMAVTLLGGSVFAKPNTKANITSEQAQEFALKRIPGAVVQSDMVKRHGKERYSIFVKEDNGITAHELISAKDGKVIWVKDETQENAKIK